MNMTKIETNYRRKIFFDNTENIELKKDSTNVEKDLIMIYPKIQYQSIVGFGGAFTVAAGYALSKLDESIYEKVISEYFGKDGLSYTLCRTHIGSCDFCNKSYSYLYDDNIDNFTIREDKEYLIPMIKKAQKQNSNIKLLASPWSPPAFMKSNNSLFLGGNLSQEYKELWSKYLLRYLQEYKKEGININYMTIQNEPNAKQIWESCIYSAEEEVDIAKNYLSPLFKGNGINTKLLIWDHNKESLFNRAKSSLNDNDTLNVIAGIAFHWYSGDHFENIKLTSEFYPGKLLIHTEGCTGYSAFRSSDEVKNAEIYGHDIIGDLNHGCNGFIDWNMVLDFKGGPNHKNNFCNSPIMINKKNTNYIKNLTFYYIGHFSKYIKPGARRIAFSKFSSKIDVTAFKNIDGSVVVVLLNQNDYNIEYNLCYDNRVFHDNLDKHTIVTFIINEDI